MNANLDYYSADGGYDSFLNLPMNRLYPYGFHTVSYEYHVALNE